MKASQKSILTGVAVVVAGAFVLRAIDYGLGRLGGSDGMTGAASPASLNGLPPQPTLAAASTTAVPGTAAWSRLANPTQTLDYWANRAGNALTRDPTPGLFGR